MNNNLKNNLYLCLMLFAVLVYCSGCIKKKVDREDKEFTRLDSLTNLWRYRSLDSAFYYSNEALSYSASTLKKNSKDFLDTLNIARAYLNHANLYFLCSRFDSADHYIKKCDEILKLWDLSKHISTLDNNTDGKPIYKTYIKENSDFKRYDQYFTKLVMLRNIQSVEIATRLFNFLEVNQYLYTEPLLNLHIKRNDWDKDTTALKEDYYDNFYGNKEWLLLKMLYNIKFAVYNHYSEISDDKQKYFEDCFDALMELSQVGDINTIDSVKEIDPQVVHYYYYTLANTYVSLARSSRDVDFIKRIKGNNSVGFAPFLETCINGIDEVKLCEKIIHFLKCELDSIEKVIEDNKPKKRMWNNLKDTTDINFLKTILNDIKSQKNSIGIKQKFAKYYYKKAFEIYFRELNKLKEDDNYWKANFLQDIAVLKMTLEKDTNKIFHNYLNSLPNYQNFQILNSLKKSDSLFNIWCDTTIDYFQLCGSKFFLAKYFWNQYNKNKNENDSVFAKQYLDSAASLNEQTLTDSANSYSIQLEEMINKLYVDIFPGSTHYQKLLKYSDFNKKVTFQDLRKRVARQRSLIDRMEKSMQEQKKREKITIILTCVLIIGIFLIIWHFVVRKPAIKRREKEKIELANAKFLTSLAPIVQHRTNTPIENLLTISDNINKLKLINSTCLSFLDIEWNKINISEDKLNNLSKRFPEKAENIRTVLTNLKKGDINLVQSLSSSENKEDITHIQNTVERIKKGFVLFDYPSPEEARQKFEDCNLFEIINEVRKDIDEKVRKHPELKPKWENTTILNEENLKNYVFFSNAFLLEEIFFNLITNTIEHAFDGTHTTVEIQIDFSETVNEYKIEYSNNGKSIDTGDNNRDIIFEAKYTTKEKNDSGLKGIGLWGTKYLIKNILNGDITVEENAVKFIITLKK